LKSNHNIIRELLKRHPDGLKSSDIAEITGIDVRSVNKSLEGVFGVYIDRWEKRNLPQHIGGNLGRR
jgi:hypothetical protein